MCSVMSERSAQHSATLWAVARQAPPATGFSSQELWSGLPFPAPGDLPDPLIETASLDSPELVDFFFFLKSLSHLGSPNLAITILLSVSRNMATLGTSCGGIVQYLSCLVSLSMSSEFIHVVA